MNLYLGLMFPTWLKQKYYEVWTQHMVKLCDLWMSKNTNWPCIPKHVCMGWIDWHANRVMICSTAYGFMPFYYHGFHSILLLWLLAILLHDDLYGFMPDCYYGFLAILLHAWLTLCVPRYDGPRHRCVQC